jgi:outer membrane protein assembly factor BamE (lipoprotein component of BamABCDE complex)
MQDVDQGKKTSVLKTRVVWHRGEQVAGVITRAVIVAGGLALVAGCSTTTTKHGHLFQENDTNQVAPGMSQDQVRGALGSPTTTATVGGGSAFYYIGSTEKQNGFLAPVETDRKVYAVYFNPQGSVDRSAQYGLKDGKVFDFSKNQTPTHAKDEGLLKSLFRNLGSKQFGLD